MFRLVFLFFFLLILVSCGEVDQSVPTDQEIATLVRLNNDTQRVIAALEAHPEIFDRSEKTPLTPEERAFLLPLWASTIDHFLVFHAYKERYLYHCEYAPGGDRGEATCLTAGLNAHAKQLEISLEFLARVSGNDALRSALNEAAPEYGVSAGFVDRMTIEVTSPQALMILDIGEEMLKEHSLSRFEGEEQADEDLRTAYHNTFAAISRANKLYDKHGMKLIRGIISIVIENEFERVFNEVVEEIATWLGDTSVRQSKDSLIKPFHLERLLPLMLPGDVIVERRNWYLSNLGLPGFWPHAALYLGSPSELAEHFDEDEEVLAQYPEGFSSYLQRQYPEAWEHYLLEEEEEPHRIIEAISEGVVFTTFSHSCLADYVGVMRPEFSKVERAMAIERAFTHWMKPYDFEFDFLTFSSLVCSELVYLAYQSTTEGEGLNFELSEVMGRITLPPNDMVRHFDEAFGGETQQLGFVAFLDGEQLTDGADFGTLEEFRESWKRSKWDLSQD